MLPMCPSEDKVLIIDTVSQNKPKTTRFQILGL